MGTVKSALTEVDRVLAFFPPADVFAATGLDPRPAGVVHGLKIITASIGTVDGADDSGKMAFFTYTDLPMDGVDAAMTVNGGIASFEDIDGTRGVCVWGRRAVDLTRGSVVAYILPA